MLIQDTNIIMYDTHMIVYDEHHMKDTHMLM